MNHHHHYATRTGKPPVMLGPAIALWLLAITLLVILLAGCNIHGHWSSNKVPYSWHEDFDTYSIYYQTNQFGWITNTITVPR
jgi:hypothetical protein